MNSFALLESGYHRNEFTNLASNFIQRNALIFNSVSKDLHLIALSLTFYVFRPSVLYKILQSTFNSNRKSQWFKRCLRLFVCLAFCALVANNTCLVVKKNTVKKMHDWRYGELMARMQSLDSLQMVEISAISGQNETYELMSQDNKRSSQWHTLRR